MAAATSRRRIAAETLARLALPALLGVVVCGIVFGANDAHAGAVARALTLAALAATALVAVLVTRTNSRVGRAERRFDRVLEHVPLVAYVDAPTATSAALYVSPQIETLLGYTKREWLEDPDLFAKLLHPDDRERVLAEHARTHETGAPLHTTYRLAAKNGDTVWIDDHAVLVETRGQRTLQGFMLDVTGQQTVLEALRESEERYRLIVEHAGEGIVVIGDDGVATFANDKFAEMLRCTRDDIVGRRIFEHMDEETAATVESKIARRFREGNTERYPVRLRRKDGDELYAVVAANPLRDSDGNVGGILALFSDMTEHLEHAEEVAAREAKFRAVFSAGTDAKLLMDDERRFVDANDAAEEVFGWAHDELLSRSFGDVLHVEPEEVDRVWAEFLDRGQMSGEFVLETAAGPRLVEFRGRAHVQPGLHLSVVRDVTEARAAEDELRRLASIVAEADDAVISTDLAGIVESWNGAAERIYGYTRGEAIGRAIFDMVSPDSRERSRAIIEALRRGEVVAGHETQVLRKDGTHVEVSLTLCPLRDRNGDVTGIGAVVRDVTEHKQLEEQLHHAQRLEAIGQLAGGVAHDFNNSLMAIRGYASLLLAKLDGDDPLRRHADGIVKAADSAAGVTRQLLAFGRKQMLQPRVVDVNDAVAEMEGLLERVIGEDIELAVDSGSRGFIRADPMQLEQVIVNLAVNARDAMPNGGRLTITTEDVEHEEQSNRRSFALPAGRYVRILVADTGMGMPAEVRDHVFEPFFSTKNVGSGTGLGLSTVYGIVKQSGGFIDVTSAPGRGTIFEILLPSAAAPRRAAAATRVRADGVEVAEATILLAEDEGVLRELIAEMLEDLGYSVLAAANGAEAIALLKDPDVAVDALLTDVVMPGMSGTELAMRANLVRPGTKLLYMSGYTDRKLLDHGARNANVAFLQKPFSAEELSQKLNDILMSRSGSAERTAV